MGFVDDMLQTESKRVVSVSNSSHSEGKSGKRTMENGCASQNGMPKYKRRRVSAIREFPLGCGRFASPISSRRDEKAICVGTSGDQEKSAGTRGSQISESMMIQRQTSFVESVAEESAFSSDHVKGLKLVNVEPAPEALNNAKLVESMKSVEPETVDVSHDLCKVVEITPVKEVCPRKYPPRRRISAVRDFPQFCGRNVPPPPKEELAKVLASTGNKISAQERSVIKENPMEETAKTNVNQVWDNGEDGDACKSKLKVSISRLSTDKVQAELKVFAKEKSMGRVVYIEDKGSETEISEICGCKDQMSEGDFEGLEPASDRAIVLGLMAGRNCPWRQVKGTNKPINLVGGTRKSKGKKNGFTLLDRPKSGFKMKMNEGESSRGVLVKNDLSPDGKGYQGLGQMVAFNKEDHLENGGGCNDFRLVRKTNKFAVSLPPSCTRSVEGDTNDAATTRNKVRETLRLFQAVCRKLLQEEEAKSKAKEKGNRKRVDLLASKILKEKGKYVNTGKQLVGSVPGVEVGDEFQYRVELNIIGLHRQIQGGIDFLKQDRNIIATSIVASGGYDDDTDNSEVLIYTGSGGNVTGGGKEPEDQKLERGNLALKNSIEAKNPVRVIRGDSRESDSSDARAKTYVYDGLYLVEKYWQEIGPHGKLVFKFRLARIPGQSELAWKVVKKSKKCKVREGLCVDDISQGKELIPICAVNTIDDEKPPPFTYVIHMIYPDWFCPESSKGCDCPRGCSESGKCCCVAKNGGEIPYNHNGAIVEAKPLVYECGPSCKCPPSCYNRVSQHGIKFQLEIFKTESRGWGVRSLNSIPSGCFICEYAGELLEEKEAEKRIGNDEYLFDIGNQYNDGSLWDGLSNLMPEAHSSSHLVVEDGCFTIDAARYGNVGRFINHSCSPNLYAQNVLYDHEDRRIPHIMLFAAENIPPLQELTYHYNYMMDQVFDSDGNIKKKKCYCGSYDCTGRMY